MNKPNPLVPQGALPQSAGKGASNVRIAVVTIVAIHVVFFGGLLMQGCKRDTGKSTGAGETNATGPLTLPAMTNAYSAPTNEPIPAAPNVGPDTNLATPGNIGNTTVGLGNTALANPDTGTTGIAAETREYTIVRNDTLGKIAKAHGTTSGAIMRANAGLDPAKLKVGQKIQIPAPANAASPATTSGAMTAAVPTSNTGAAGVHVVKAGETLTRIAKQHGITLKALRTANNLKTDRVVPGQKLKLPGKTNSPASGLGSAPGPVVNHTASH